MPSIARLALVAILLLPAAGFAQGYPAPAPVLVSPSNPVPPQMFEGLSDAPSTHAGFTLDRSLVRDLLVQGGLDERRAAAAVSSVTIDNYNFPREAFYVPEAMALLSNTYRVAGWKHLVDQENRTPAANAQPRNALTDLWLHFSGADIDGVTVLRRGPRNMNVISVTGDLRPLDLLHLSGHFGIPKLDSDAVSPRMVPAP